MSRLVLMQGNEACVEGAIAAGMRLYAGYPITPSTEIAEYAAVRLPQTGGKFIQMEDEIASIACAIGASAAGVRSMTSTSGPGFSLKQENLGYACLAEIPLVLTVVQRVGPSTGMPTSPSQGDVMMARWGTHGDHPIIALSPSSVQETYDLTIRAFELAYRYRSPVIFLMDEMIGHLREGFRMPDSDETAEPPADDHDGTAACDGEWKPYRTRPGSLVPDLPAFGKGRRYNITGLIHDENGFPTNSSKEAEKLMYRLMHKISDNYDDIVSCELTGMEDADIAVFCYGGTARAAATAVKEARKLGIRCGIFRPVTIWPFPERELELESLHLKHILVVEHNYGQLVHEVERVIRNSCRVSFLGRYNGTVITPQEILEKIRTL